MRCGHGPLALAAGRLAVAWAVLGCLILWQPAAALADEKALPVEALLPADAALYLRFDGLDACSEAFNETAFGQLLASDLKPLTDFAFGQLVDALGPAFLSEQLLRGAQPETLLELQQAADALPRLLIRLKDHGAAATLEVINPIKPRLQLTLVIPNVQDDADRATIANSFRLLALINGVPVEIAQHQGRQVLQFQMGDARFALWSEGGHMVATIGSEPPEHALAVIKGDRLSLAKSELLKLVQTPVPYVSCARGFVNVKGVMAVINEAFPPAQVVFTALGLHPLESFAFQYGFEGKYQRATAWVAMPGERTGLLRLFTSSESIALDKLPALPPQPTLVYATRMEWSQLYDDAVAAAKSIVQIAVPFGTPDVDQAIGDFNRTLGFKLRDDLIQSLGQRLVVFDAADQGPFMIGTTLAIEVRDEAKLRSMIDKLVTAINAAFETDFVLRTTEYRGVSISVVDSGSGANVEFLRLTFAIHRGWLVASLLPQAVQGFVYRNGDNPARRWEPPPVLKQVLGDAKGGRLVGVSLSDPRPAMEQVMSSLPLIIDVQRQLNDSGTRFDVTLLPPAQAITDLSEPAVAATFDDGHTVRIEWRSTVPFPAMMTGLNTQMLFLLAFAVSF